MGLRVEEGGSKSIFAKEEDLGSLPDAGAEGDSDFAGNALIWLCGRDTWRRQVDGARRRGDSTWLGLGGHSGFWSGRAPPQFVHHYLSDPEPEASKTSLEASKMPDEPFVAP